MSYKQDAISAYKDLRSSGVAVVIEAPATPTVDQSTGTVTNGGTPTLYPTYAVVLPAKPGAADTFETAARIRTNMRKMLVPGYRLAVFPLTGWVVIVEGERWTIRSASTISPDAKTAIMHTLMVEK